MKLIDRFLMLAIALNVLNPSDIGFKQFLGLVCVWYIITLFFEIIRKVDKLIRESEQ